MKEKNSRIIALSGASGFVGVHLSRALQRTGWSVTPLSRQDLGGNAIALAKSLCGAQGVINLAGAPILGRWTPAYKKTLVDSRIGVTRRLVEAISVMPDKPEFFLSTSAVGYYAADHRHTEESHVQADDFLGHLTRDWEKEAAGAATLGLRTIIFRLGVVLGPGSGALKQMLPPFRLGLGGTIGHGGQAFSWIHLDDLLAAYLAAVTDQTWEGVYNLTAPEPTTNAVLTHTLGAALSRPTCFSVPEFILRLRFGEGAMLLTHGQEVIPKRLLEAGFQFTISTIDQAVKRCLADWSPS